ncbi:hypothetical protein [Streptomyces sp. NPDC048157]|uniref:hypothetical protein n=1 Tax=Streptomyces sp. NPDC048157 TaxID=3365503 RepID=UPI0037124838
MTELKEAPAMDAPPPPPPADSAPQQPKRRGRPPGSTDKAPRKTAASARKASTPSLEKRLAGSLTTVGTMACLVSPADGMTIVQGVPALAASLAKLAEENASVRANLERMLTAGAWSGVIAAVVPIAVGIAANHNLLPAHMAAMLGAGPATGPESAGAPAS